jgi:hypothetical protein
MAETNVKVLDSGMKMGPAGDACHMQIMSGKGGTPMRTKKMMPGGMGFMVTSPAPMTKITSK